MIRSLAGWRAAPLALALGACSSQTPQAPPTKTGSALCTTARDPGPAVIRRLTRTEYGRTLRDLLGAGLVDTSTLPPDEQALGFDNNADVLGTSDLLVEQLAGLAEAAGEVVAKNPTPFAPCAESAADAACGSTFVATFGRRAWRRDLSAAELTALTDVFASGQADVGFSEGVVRAVSVMLQSPQFLYRVEVGGDAVADLPGAVRLTSSEVASRLSYLIWGSMPDEALLQAAAADALTTPAQIEQAARRLLADPRAHEVVASFHAQWLGLDGLKELDKDTVVYSTFTPALRTSLRAETERFVEEVVWKGEGTLSALLSASYSFVDAGLASYYGVTAPSGTGLQRIDFDKTRRAGLLTQGSILAVHSKPNQSSPVHRGRFVREQLLCTTPQPPPANLEIRPPALDPRKTTRQRFSEHTTDAFCAICHKMLDPIGFGFEHYDGIGRWRDTESGLPVDAHGALTGTDVDGDFDGVPALAQRLARSSDVSACYATQWFRFGYGRGETTDDACTLAQLSGALTAAKGDVRELIVALTQTEGFRFRRQEVTP